MDIEKVFESLDPYFLISSLEKYGFVQSFVLCVQILLKDQEMCVINGGKTTKYFMLGRGAFQSDPILAFLFCLSVRDLIYSYKDKIWNWITDNL